MNFSNYTCGEFSEQLASHSPTPGGGSAAAMTGSYGAALCAMAAVFTIGREKYAAHEELMKETLSQANNLRAEFLTAASADSEAYNAVGAALSMPKSTLDEKAARAQTLQEALKQAAAVPFGVMELSLKALRLTDKITGISNRSVASDLGVAALSLRASLCGAWLNVRTNLTGIKDEAFAAEFRQKGEALMAEALPLADSIYDNISRACEGKTP